MVVLVNILVFVGINQDNKWKAQIQIDGKLNILGRFDDEKEAGETYQIALKNIQLFENPKQFRELIDNTRNRAQLSLF